MSFKDIFKRTDLVMPILLIGILLLMIVPIPPMVMDFFLVISLGSGLAILLMAVYVKRPLDFNVFPTLLLMTVLLRLSLNVASTRLILLHGSTQGLNAAGHIIKSFGDFVVGGNYAVGFIIFLILVIINFIVITKGAGRVAEVAARFTLDAMPGKQMAIDAELNSGVISEEDAKKRRAQITQEADFYGSMDGASKFVRGDAIAGLLITFINIVGGFIIGVAQDGMSFADAAKVFTLLTIGEGLVAQIPAIIISVAAGIIVTRVASDETLGSDVKNQMFENPVVLYATGGILVFMALMPGFPGFIFVFLGLCTIGIGYLAQQIKDKKEKDILDKEKEIAMKPKNEKVESMLPLDQLSLHVGYGLVYLVDTDQNGDLLTRINQIRKQFARELGIIIPSIQIQDNLELSPGQYKVFIKGNEVSTYEVALNHHLAMDPGTVTEKIDGVATTEPAFQLDATWVTDEQKDNANLNGYTVVDISTVIATHITELIRKHAYEFVNRQFVQQLLDVLKETYPKVVEEIIPAQVNMTMVVKVLQNLLREQVPVRDMLTIIETLGDHSHLTKDSMVMTEFCRSALARTITRKLEGDDGKINVLTLSQGIEETIAGSLVQSEIGVQAAVEPAFLANLVLSLKKKLEEISTTTYNQVLLVSPAIRSHLHRLVERFLPHLVVISHQEIVSHTSITNIGEVSLNKDVG